MTLEKVLVKRRHSTAVELRFWYGLVGKGVFIREHGREAWDALPHHLIHRFGRRYYVGQRTVLDKMWLAYQGKVHCEFLAFDVNPKMYANDTGCEIEMRRMPRAMPS